MKKVICLLLVFGLVFSLSSCSPGNPLSISSCELYETSTGLNGKFIILNSGKNTVKNLTVTICGYDENGKELITQSASYSLDIKEKEEATVTVALDPECESASAVSYSYQAPDGKSVKGEFSQNKAVLIQKTTEVTEIKTRAQLAEVLIEDVEHQFMLQAFEAHGYYDEEKKQLIIASYITKTYDECYYAYTLDNTAYDSLEESVTKMSLTCYEEFQKYKFNDVEVSVGFLSSDEKIMISATNGKLIDTFN